MRTKRLCLLLSVLGTLAVTCGEVDQEAKAAPPGKPSRGVSRPKVAPGHIAKWIAQLSAATSERRDRATRRLLEDLEAAEAALRKALKDRSLSTEARERILYLLSRIDIPQSSVGWWGRGGRKAPKGLKRGDVILRINGSKISTWRDFWTAAEDGDATYDLLVWRKGVGKFSLKTQCGGQKRLGFASCGAWEGKESVYSKRGKWDAKVFEGISKLLGGDPGAAKAFAAAWKAGCREALVYRLRLRSLHQAGDHEAAAGLLKAPPKDLVDAMPGREELHGRLPFEIARHHLAAGQRERAEQVMDEAAAKARAAGAWKGLHALRWGQMRMKRSGPADEAMKFWTDHAEALLLDRESAEDVILQMAQHLAAEGRPDRAAAFLKDVPQWDFVRGVRPYYAAQAEIAKSARTRPAAGAPILVKVVPGPFVRQAPLDHYKTIVVWRGQPPVRLDCETRLVSFPRRAGRFWSTSSVRLRGERRLTAWLGREGSVTGDGDAPPGACPRSGAVFGPLQWHAVSLEARRRFSRVLVDGRPVWRQLHPERGRGTLSASMHASGCKAEYRNLRIYVYTERDVDPRKAERLFVARRAAMRAGDLKKARRAHNRLVGLWAEIPQTRDAREAIKREMAWFEKIMSADGLSLCSQDVLNAGLADPRSWGKWELRDGRLTGQAKPGEGGAELYVPLMAPDNVQITGVFEVENPGHRNTFVAFAWNTSVWDSRTRVAFWPRHRQAAIIEKRRERETVKNVDYSSPVPFCIRSRKAKTALFVRFGAKPDAQASCEPVRTGDSILLQLQWVRGGTRVHLSKLKIRHLPKDTPPDAPVRLPRATTRPAKETQQW